MRFTDHRRRLPLWALLGCLTLSGAACEDEGAPPAGSEDGSVVPGRADGGTPPAGGTTLGDLHDRMQQGDPTDSDNDLIPDAVERELCTDPESRDSDRDGLYDYTEIFGENQPFDRDAYLPDVDGDGVIAACDDDDDGDGVNDGASVDSDGDGIANYLEYYGYTYNWMSGQFLARGSDAVKADPSVPYFKTDPLQPSTDQDPYSDSMEVSNAQMDVSVLEPGNLPMVPAYPDIVVKLAGYVVTLNEDITTSSGKSLSKGQDWEASTERSLTQTNESSWEVGTEVSVTAKASLTDFGGEASWSMSAKYGETRSTSLSSGVTQSRGGSLIEQQDWSSARSLNPTDAAHIKLLLKVYNYGTATASNVIPTFTLRIGGRNVATFEQGNAQINLLEPGGVYPAAPDVYWVIDSIDTGAGVAPISLTIDELRALETGAPVTVQLTQLLAAVVGQDAQGHWQELGDWRAYMARFDAVSARLSIDVGDGNLISYLIYADDAPSAPEVTLRDTLLWVAGGRADAESQKIRYQDRVNGGVAEKSLEGWHVLLDGATWQANKTRWDKDGDGTVDEDFNILDMVLGPSSEITAKLPHDDALTTGAPTIHYAYYDRVHSLVAAYLSDYYGVASVSLRLGEAPDAEVVELTEDFAGTGYYSATLDPAYAWQDDETLVAENVRGRQSESSVEALYNGPIEAVDAPLIRWVKLDHNELTITAEVEPRAEGSVAGVTLQLHESSHPPIELTRFGDRENVWTAALPDGYHQPTARELLVARSARGFVSASAVTDRVPVHAAGTTVLVYAQTEEYNHTYEAASVVGFDVETVAAVSANLADWTLTCGFGPYAPHQQPDSGYPNWNPNTEIVGLGLHWGPDMGLKLGGNASWAALKKSDLTLMQPVMYPDLVSQDAKQGDAIVAHHPPYLLKAIVENVEHGYVARGEGLVAGHYDHFDTDHLVAVHLRYVIFSP